MTPEEYRDALLQVTQELTSLVARLLGLLPASPDDRIWNAFIGQVYPAVMAARRQAYLLSLEFYESQRAAQGVPDDLDRPQPPSERYYPPDALDKALTETTRARLEGEDELELDRQMIEAETLATVERHAMASGRDAIADQVRDDPKAIGYARVMSGAETCAFCLMLASRGPVYKSQRSASRTEEGRAYHNRCDCVPVPVFNRDDWPGRDAYLEAERTYKKATRGKSGAEALRALRAHVEG